MLSKPYRFHSRGGVKYTYRHGTTLRAHRVALIYAPNKYRRQRFAVVVSKKVLKSAVGRNRIRRRVYETIRQQLPTFSLPVDCIFVIYSADLKDLDYTKLHQLISGLLAQIVL